MAAPGAKEELRATGQKGCRLWPVHSGFVFSRIALLNTDTRPFSSREIPMLPDRAFFDQLADAAKAEGGA